MRGSETPGRIMTNFCTGVGVHDIITCADLYYDRLRDLGVAGGRVIFWAFPLTCFVVLTTLAHYHASVRTTCECVICLKKDTQSACALYLNLLTERLNQSQ